MQKQSFEKFYYSKVATGEGCGCAERIIDVHEFNRLAGKTATVRRRGGFRRFLQKWGLTRRPDAPDQS